MHETYLLSDYLCFLINNSLGIIPRERLSRCQSASSCNWSLIKTHEKFVYKGEMPSPLEGNFSLLAFRLEKDFCIRETLKLFCEISLGKALWGATRTFIWKRIALAVTRSNPEGLTLSCLGYYVTDERSDELGEITHCDGMESSLSWPEILLKKPSLMNASNLFDVFGW